MKIYIHTDLEGVSGVDRAEMMERGTPLYRQAVERLMADVNAAVDGCFAGGAKQVTVLDSHGGGGNFDLNLLDKRADNDPKANKKWWGKLDESYAGTLFIGAHAMAGTQNAFLEHTQSSKAWYGYFINGREMGELAQWAMVAGHFNVPMLMASGDDAACTEARVFFDPVETASVKRGCGRNRAELVPSDEAIARIREAARRSMALVGKAKPFRPVKPLEIILQVQRTDHADAHALNPGNERIGSRTIRKVSNDYLDLFP